MAHCDLGPRTLIATPAPDQFDGEVTFAVKLPVQQNAEDNPVSFALLFEALGGAPARETSARRKGRTSRGRCGAP